MNFAEPRPPYDLSGITPPNYRPLRRLRKRLKLLFPEDAAYADRCWEELYEDDPVGGGWLTAFAERTTEAIRKRDTATMAAHLDFMSSLLHKAGSDLTHMIEVNYMEGLFYRLDQRSRHWAWSRIPDNLKKLYINCWGHITPSKIACLQAGWPRRSR